MKADFDVYVPELRERRKRRMFYLLPLYVFVGLYIVLFAALWLSSLSPFFRVDKIQISGNASVAEGDVLDLLRAKVLDQRFWKSALGFNNMFIWPEALSSSDLTFLPSVKSLEITKNYRDHTLDVQVQERTPFGIWCLRGSGGIGTEFAGDETCWWFDEEGFVFKRAISSEGSLINTIHDFSQNKLGLNLKILPETFIRNTISIFNVLKNSGLSVQSIVLRDLSLRELEVTTYDGPRVYFSLSFPADSFIQVIKEFESKPGFAKLQYLDFRVENKLYYK